MPNRGLVLLSSACGTSGYFASASGSCFLLVQLQRLLPLPPHQWLRDRSVMSVFSPATLQSEKVWRGLSSAFVHQVQVIQVLQYKSEFKHCPGAPACRSLWLFGLAKLPFHHSKCYLKTIHSFSVQFFKMLIDEPVQAEPFLWTVEKWTRVSNTVVLIITHLNFNYEIVLAAGIKKKKKATYC